jgi:hypothetical protein
MPLLRTDPGELQGRPSTVFRVITAEVGGWSVDGVGPNHVGVLGKADNQRGDDQVCLPEQSPGSRGAPPNCVSSSRATFTRGGQALFPRSSGTCTPGRAHVVTRWRL